MRLYVARCDGGLQSARIHLTEVRDGRPTGSTLCGHPALAVGSVGGTANCGSCLRTYRRWQSWSATEVVTVNPCQAPGCGYFFDWNANDKKYGCPNCYGEGIR